MRRKVIGPLLKLAQAIPVERAQDLAQKGPGHIDRVENGVVYGINTKFTTLQPKTVIKIGKIEVKLV